MPIEAPDPACISELVCRWVDGSIAPVEITRLVRAAVEIVNLRLGGEVYSVVRSEGIRSETLAMSLITPLLGEQPGPASQIGRSWRRNPPPASPAGVVSWFESLVFVTAVRQLARRDIDRYRARGRVRRRLREAIRASTILGGFPSDRFEYVRLEASTDHTPNAQQVSPDDVQKAVDSNWRVDLGDAANIEMVVSALSELPNRCSLIPFALLCQAVLTKEQAIDRSDLEARVRRPDRNPEFAVKLEKSIEAALKATDPILNRYCQRGRQTRDECHWMRQGAGLFLRLSALGQEPVQHECLAEFWPGLTRDRYREDQNIRERFEYVVRVAWNCFGSLWKP